MRRSSTPALTEPSLICPRDDELFDIRGSKCAGEDQPFTVQEHDASGGSTYRGVTRSSISCAPARPWFSMMHRLGIRFLPIPTSFRVVPVPFYVSR